MKMFFSFLTGLLVGILGYFIFGWNDAFGPPANQDAVVVPVSITELGIKDRWLTGARAYISPLNGIWSNRKYSVLIVVPPSNGIETVINSSSILNLEVKGISIIQPMSISTRDFGLNGQQIAVKMIDEGVVFNQTYSSNQNITLRSGP